MKRIRKLVLPVGGLGKRLRPLTNRCPKALVPLGNGVLLDHMLLEAAASGITEVILILNPLHIRQFKAYIERSRKKFADIAFHIRLQETPGGNGHAIMQAADLLHREPFAVRFCDDIIFQNPPVLQSLIEIYNTHRAPVVLLEKVPMRLVSRYGVVGVQKASKKNGVPKSGRLFRITKIIEKPAQNRAPSNLIIVGGYILTPSVMRNLVKIAESLPIVAPDALPLAVALQIELIIGGTVFGWQFPGKRLDCGTVEALQNTEKFLNRTERGF